MGWGWGCGWGIDVRMRRMWGVVAVVEKQDGMYDVILCQAASAPTTSETGEEYAVRR